MNIDWSKAPEDATHYLRETDDVYECWIKPGFSMRCNFQDSWVKDDTVEKDIEDGVAIRRPTAWTGTGLPPVGTVCEVLHKNEWMRCEIVANKDIGGVIHAIAWIDADRVDQSQGVRLRPLKTQAQIEAEEREEFANKLVLEMGKSPTGYPNAMNQARKIYDLGYRKQSKEDA